MAESSYLPLRWESTGDQWWYASPIDFAAANGHYDLVRELLRIDSNLLIKLTSLRRIRRLETVWDDDSRFSDAARCRSQVARKLFLDCDTDGGNNSLISSGYGGWLVYTAASAGDTKFIRELLQRDPLLVFGEGEYGVSDILYAAARSKNSELFRLLLEFTASPRCPGALPSSPFAAEITNRAAHAAARGGNLEILRELISISFNPLDLRDARGSTVLHAAGARNQLEVVKWLVDSFEIMDSADDEGNTALHTAAFQGQLRVLEAMVAAAPPCAGWTNNAGNTLLHAAIAGFATPGFRRLDRQTELVKWLVTAKNLIKIEEMVNARNGDGLTALHLAVAGDLPAEVVELLLGVPEIDPDVQDGDGMTALDLLRRRPRSLSTEVMIRQVVSAGGTLKSSAIGRYRAKAPPKLRLPASPGTEFGVPDAEIFLLFCGHADPGSRRSSSCSSSGTTTTTKKKKESAVVSAARHMKHLLTRSRSKKGKAVQGDNSSSDDNAPTPLRQRFPQASTLHANKRVLAWNQSSPADSVASSSSSGYAEEKTPSSSKPPSPRSQEQGFFKARLMTRRYLCLGAERTKERPGEGRRSAEFFKRPARSPA